MTPDTSTPPAGLLPHAGDMVLLHAILESGERHCVCRTEVDRLTLFRREDGSVASWMAIELMAQAVAAQARLAGGGDGPPRPGFLAGVRRMECHEPSFHPGQRLRIRVERTFGETTGLARFEATLHDEDTGRPLAEASLTLHVPDPVTPAPA